MKNIQSKQHVTVHNKKYPYTLTRVNKKVSAVRCDAAHIDQEFLNEDIPALIIDLPNLILSEKKYKEQNEIIRFRVTSKDKKKIEKKALENGYVTVSGFLRALALGV